MKTYTEDELGVIRDRHEAWLLAQPGVTGTSIGLGKDSRIVLRIFASGVSPNTRQAVAARLREIPIAWEEGDIVAQ